MDKTSLLLRLPVELVEEIVLCAAASGDLTAPASLALTCRALRSSILAAQTHLWRHLFLTVFDQLSHPACTYETSYKSRISAHLFFQARAVDPERPAEGEHVAQVLESVLDVLHTARPLDSRALEPDTPSASTHPVFPPLSIILHSSPGRVPPSLNTHFVSRILAPGLPPCLASRLDAYCVTPATPRELFDAPLARLVAAVGPLQAAPRPFFGPHMPEGGETSIEKPDGVRRLARIRAYDMTYLHVTRLHAPFLPIHTTDSTLLVPTRSILSHTLDEIEDGSSSSTSSPASDHPPAAFPDPPTHAPGIPSFAHAYASEPPSHLIHFDWTWLSAARTVVQHNLRDLLALRHAHALRALVALDGLRVGAAPGFVADDAPVEIRIRVEGKAAAEENERGTPADLLLDRLIEDTSFIDRDPNAFDGPESSALAEALQPAPIREDGSCMAMPPSGNEWVGVGKCEVVDRDEKANADVDGKGKGKGKCKADVLGEECEGWDWAGVAGQWRRCVCWLDYKDLVAHNTHPFDQRFMDPTLYEVMRIIPMTLRVDKYTRSSRTRRPTIHISGTVAGAQAAHTVWGKVEEVAGGDVRWSLFTLREDGESAWKSDGVQLGGPGSAAGVLGMWTSAEHEHMDPLGPFWAWKVGAARAPGVHPTSGLGAAGTEEPQSVQGKRPLSRREPER